jgi:hypothetical protein
MIKVLLLRGSGRGNPAKKGLAAALPPFLAVTHPNQILKKSTSRL